MFIGEYKYLIDEKKRIAIPSKLRKDLGKRAVVTRGLDSCLVLYPIGEWQKLAEKLQGLPANRVDARGFVRVLLSGAAFVDFDKLGRILIPDYLKKYAFLKKQVIIIGLGNRIELWDEKRWEDYKKKTEQEVGDIGERIQELGV